MLRISQHFGDKCPALAACQGRLRALVSTKAAETLDGINEMLFEGLSNWPRIRCRRGLPKGRPEGAEPLGVQFRGIFAPDNVRSAWILRVDESIAALRVGPETGSESAGNVD